MTGNFEEDAFGQERSLEQWIAMLVCLTLSSVTFRVF